MTGKPRLNQDRGRLEMKDVLTKWPANAVVSLSEKRNGATKFGELRSDGTQMKIWSKQGNTFAPGNAEDQKWADGLLSAFNLDDTPEPEKKKEAAQYGLDDPQFAQKLATLENKRTHQIGRS
jgi:hypothetical protein